MKLTPLGNDARLPRPQRARWTPLRAGIINIWQYDDQRFVFNAGRLLLRGRNGAGKSKALEVLLPFLLDADLSPRRLDPFGSSARTMRWNLVEQSDAQVSIGYVFIEFGRQEAGEDAYCTLGVGLRAHREGAVTPWFFTTSERVDESLHLLKANRSPLSRSELAVALSDSGRVFESKSDYRAEVNRLLFGMAPEQYDALITALLQLRRPQLSKALQPEELSRILSMSLPPLDGQLMGRLAEGFERLKAHRRELEDRSAARREVGLFLRAYRAYAKVVLKGLTRQLTQSDSAFHAARADWRREQEAHQKTEGALQECKERLTACATEQERLLAAREALRNSEEFSRVRDLDRLGEELRTCEHQEATLQQRVAQAQSEELRAREAQLTAEDHLQACAARLDNACAQTEVAAGEAALADAHAGLLAALRSGGRSAAGAIEAVRQQRRQVLADLEKLQQAKAQAQTQARSAEQRVADAQAQAADARQAAEEARARLVAVRQDLDDALSLWLAHLQVLELSQAEVQALEGLEPHHRAAALAPHATRARRALEARIEALAGELSAIGRRLEQLRREHAELTAQPHPTPEAPAWRTHRHERPGAPLYLLCDPRPGTQNLEGLEAALQSSGLLDAWVTPDGRLLDPHTHDSLLTVGPPSSGPTLREVLQPAAQQEVAPGLVNAVLEQIGWFAEAAPEASDATPPTWVCADGRWRLGVLRGAWQKHTVEYLGAHARELTRQGRLAKLADDIEQAEAEEHAGRQRREELATQSARLDQEQANFPKADDYLRATEQANAAALHHETAACALATAEAEHARYADLLAQRTRALHARAAECGLPGWVDRLGVLRELTHEYVAALGELRAHADDCGRAHHQVEQTHLRLSECAERGAAAAEDYQFATTKTQVTRGQRDTLQASLGSTAAALHEELERLGEALENGKLTDRRQRKEHDDLLKAAAAGQVRVQSCEERAQAKEGLRQQARAQLAQGLGEGLAAVLDDEPRMLDEDASYTDALLLARKLDAHIGDIDCSGTARDTADNRVVQRQQELTRSLGAHVRLQAERHHGVLVYQVVLPERSHSLRSYDAALAHEVEERARLLNDEEMGLFESFLSGETHEHLASRLRQAQALIDEMNQQLQARPTASGMRLRLKWQLAEEVPTGTEQAIALMHRDLLAPEDRNTLAAFLRQRLNEAQLGEVGAFRDNVLSVLDYRGWYRFAIEFRRKDAPWKTLTSKAHATGSGGEKAVMLHMPLFAAAAAFYAGSQASPRLIMLDEAFAGIDKPMRAQLMGLLAQFDLDFMMTSHEEWGFYRELDGLATYHLSTAEGLPGVCAEWFMWDGEQSHELGATL